MRAWNLRAGRSPGYNDAAWKAAQILPPPGGTAVGPKHRADPRHRNAQADRDGRSPKQGVYVFDMGQNLVGWCRLQVKGPAGTTVRLRHAETLQPDGMLYTGQPPHSTRCTDLYTLKGDGREVYEPRFTYHGFRYVEVTGYPGEPASDAVEACVVHDDLEPAGDFACSNELLNRIHANCRWGIRGNYRSIPTDCPQRDERQGWLGDRATGCRGEMQLFNVAAFYEKWLTDIADSQRADGSVSDVCPAYWPFYNDNVTWAGTIALVPDDAAANSTATQRLIVRHYPAMRAWVEHMCQFLVDDRMPRDTYGDWCVPPEDPKLDPFQGSDPQDQRRIDRHGVLSTHSAVDEPVCRAGGQAGTMPPAYASLAERMKTAFNKRFFNAEAAQYDNGTQTSSLLPLSFGLVPGDAARPPVRAARRQDRRRVQVARRHGIGGRAALDARAFGQRSARPGPADRHAAGLSGLGLHGRQGRHDHLGTVERRHGRPGHELGQPRDADRRLAAVDVRVSGRHPARSVQRRAIAGSC